MKKASFWLPSWFWIYNSQVYNFSNDYISVCNQETFERMFLFYSLTVLNSLLAKLVVGSFVVENNSKTMNTYLLVQINRVYLLFFSLYFRTTYCFIAHSHRPQRIIGEKKELCITSNWSFPYLTKGQNISMAKFSFFYFF